MSDEISTEMIESGIAAEILFAGNRAGKTSIICDIVKYYLDNGQGLSIWCIGSSLHVMRHTMCDHFLENTKYKIQYKPGSGGMFDYIRYKDNKVGFISQHEKEERLWWSRPDIVCIDEPVSHRYLKLVLCRCEQRLFYALTDLSGHSVELMDVVKRFNSLRVRQLRSPLGENCLRQVASDKERVARAVGFPYD